MARKVSKAFLLYLSIFFCGDSTASRKLRSPGLDGRKSEQLDECGRCKVLTDSFNYWLQKTSRGKYEGGDAAWEESKLKSYARSEIRLVEIQESLCSELKMHQDYCYILSEEAEQVLEKWWFQEDPYSVDLKTWLCIETLKYCCPVNHFGDTCTLCPRDKNNKICGGHGKCDGDGTRKGNGTCICKRGYTGNNCEECVESFFSARDGTCEQCHWACNGCSGEGPSACHSCKPGWQLESGVCVDLNECLSPASCKTNELCVNKEGTFKCKACDTTCKTCAGTGDKNCTSCEPVSILWGGMCITRDQQYIVLYDTVKRLCLYLLLVTGLTLISLKTQVNLGPVLFTLSAIVMYLILWYYVEIGSEMNTLDVVLTIYETFDFKELISDVVRKITKMFV